MVEIDPGEDAGSVPHRQSIRFGRPGGIGARVVAISPGSALSPPECACCGATAGVSRQESDGQRSLIVPYCEPCLHHATLGVTRDLSASLAGCLLAATAAIALPLGFGSLSLGLHALLAVLLASLPVAVRWLVRPRLAPGHTARERAVWWVNDGVACTHPKFAEHLARANDTSSEARAAPYPAPATWIYAGAFLALLATPFGWTFVHPIVRVINLSPERLLLSIDGRDVGSVDPTSAESPAAGVELRLPSGRRTLVARTPDGSAVARSVVDIRPGDKHLWAPASQGICFWLEQTHYGRNRPPAEVRALVSEQRFWPLPEIDTWFSPNPPPSEADGRSSGGTLWALRQAPCSQAPQSVRNQASLASPAQ
jgi:hypothetical protein